MLYRLSEHIGSGQFGLVYKGVLLRKDKIQVEVAVKTLKEGSGENDRVKFLQEAAIMGQFKHPNVVEMFGVVSEGEPVSMQIRQYIVKGRNFTCGICHNVAITTNKAQY